MCYRPAVLRPRYRQSAEFGNEQGFTINGARHRLESEAAEPRAAARAERSATVIPAVDSEPAALRAELEAIRDLLKPAPDKL